MAEQIIEPPFPIAGVVRSTRNWGDMAVGEKPSTPWAVNVQPTGQLSSRLRGGSRPGLTETTDSRKVQTDRLVTEAGDYITTEAGDYITVSTSTAIDTSDGRSWVHVGSDAPSGYTATCLYRDRVCMSSTSSLAVYMSRMGTYHDWDTQADVEDAGRAALIQLAEAGEWFSEEDGVTALIPYQDSALLMATANTLWVLVGDPTDGGQMRCVSRDVGIINQKAWCKAEGAVFFMSSRGLFAVGGDGSGLKSLSEDSVPEELADVSSAILGYRADDGGIYIFTSGSYHWYYHLSTGGLWPFTLASGHVPTSVFKSGRDLVLVCTDETVRKIGGDDDDGTDIQSHVLLGPFRTVGGDMSGLLLSLEAAFGVGSGNVSWAIVAGNSADDVATDGKTAIGLHLAGNESGAQAYTKASGTLEHGRSFRSFPRVRSQWFAVWLHSEAKWTFEWLGCRIAEAGRYR